jgi:hypothetical protein
MLCQEYVQGMSSECIQHSDTFQACQSAKPKAAFGRDLPPWVMKLSVDFALHPEAMHPSPPELEQTASQLKDTLSACVVAFQLLPKKSSMGNTCDSVEDTAQASDLWPHYLSTMAHTVNEMLNGSAQNRVQKFMTDVNVVRLNLFHLSWAVAYKFYSQQIKLPTEADS